MFSNQAAMVISLCGRHWQHMRQTTQEASCTLAIIIIGGALDLGLAPTAQLKLYNGR
jgi:hypothetical protein